MAGGGMHLAHNVLGARVLVGDAGAEEGPERRSLPSPAQPFDSGARAAGSSRRVLGHGQRVAVFGELGEEGLQLRAVLGKPLQKRDEDRGRECEKVVHNPDQEVSSHLECGRNTRREGSKRVDPGRGLLLRPRVWGRERVQRQRRSSNAQHDSSEGRINVSKGSVASSRGRAGRSSAGRSPGRSSAGSRSAGRRTTGRRFTGRCTGYSSAGRSFTGCSSARSSLPRRAGHQRREVALLQKTKRSG